MKIAFVVDNHSPAYGGPYTVISDQAYNLYKNNINIKVLYNSNSFGKFNRNYSEIFKRIDLVHIFGIWRPKIIFAFLQAKKQKKKIIISPLGALEPWSMSQKKIKKLIAWKVYQKNMLNYSDYIHATSDTEKENILNKSINTPIKVIPHGTKIYDTLLEKKSQNIKKAVFFSRIHEKKGLLELVECWSRINPKNWQLNIYGPVSNTDYLNQIKNKILNTQLHNKINIHNPIFDREKKINTMSDSSLFLLPSKSENFGMSILEALSFGIPVLTTTETPWEKLNKFNAGMVIKFSKENLMSALNFLLKMDEKKLYEIGNNGREYAKKYYDIEKIIKEYIAFYKSL